MTTSPARAVVLVLIAPYALARSLDAANPEAIAILCSAVLLWMTELVPLAVTALGIPLAATLLGVLPVTRAFVSFSHQIIFLIVGVFFLSRAIQKHSLDKRIAFALLSKPILSKSPERMVIGLTLVSWLMGMWISNTATCAILLPLALGVAVTVGTQLPTAERQRFTTRMLLVTAFTPSIAGISTPVGSLPNLVALQALETAGRGIPFFRWMMVGVPISALLLTVSYFVLKFRYPLHHLEVKEGSRYFIDQGRLSEK